MTSFALRMPPKRVRLNGLITPVLLVFILVLANRRSLLGDAANRPLFKAVATVCVAGVGALALAVVVLTALGKA